MRRPTPHYTQVRNPAANGPAGRIAVALDIVPDEDDPHALLAAQDVYGEPLAQVRVVANFKLTLASAESWVANDYRKPS